MRGGDRFAFHVSASLTDDEVSALIDMLQDPPYEISDSDDYAVMAESADPDGEPMVCGAIAVSVSKVDGMKAFLTIETDSDWGFGSMGFYLDGDEVDELIRNLKDVKDRRMGT